MAAAVGLDSRHVDGIGGGDLLLNKVAIVSKSRRADADVEVTFGCLPAGAAQVAYGANCGNLVAAAALYASQEGLAQTRSDGVVRVYSADSDCLIEARHGGLVDDRRREICQSAGMPATGTWVDLDFLSPSGTAQPRLLPTGNASDHVRLGGMDIEVSIVDCGALYVFIRAQDLGLDIARIGKDVQHNIAAMRLLETIRGHAAVMAHIVDKPQDALALSPAIPKLALVGPPESYSLDGPDGAVSGNMIDLTSRIISTQKFHNAYAVTGAIATAAAVAVEGSIVARCVPLRRRLEQRETTRAAEATNWLHLRIGHPTGSIGCSIKAISTKADITIDRARIGRTARRIMTGEILLPEIKLKEVAEAQPRAAMPR